MFFYSLFTFPLCDFRNNLILILSHTTFDAGKLTLALATIAVAINKKINKLIKQFYQIRLNQIVLNFNNSSKLIKEFVIINESINKSFL